MTIAPPCQPVGLGVLYPFEARPAPGWVMPRPTMPIGQFSQERLDTWLADRWGSSQLTPNLQLFWMPGAASDGASIPWFLQTGLTPRFEGTTFAPAWGHDLNYAGRLVTRAMADWIFYRQLLACNVHPAKALGYYAAVRALGGAVWARHTPESVAAGRRRAGIRMMEVAA